MVSFNVYKSTSSGIYVEGVCLTSDTMPVAGIANGSILFAVDPSDGGMIRYMFNQSSASWVETTCPCSGGGSGGGGEGGDSGGGANVLVVNLSYDEDTEVSTADKTAGEMLEADFIVFVSRGDNFAEKNLCVQAAYTEGEGYYFRPTEATGIELFADSADEYSSSQSPDDPDDPVTAS